MPLPLEGVRVLDCTMIMAGPLCTMVLGDLGADVIKVERPEGGDESRRFPPFVNGVSAPFLMLNRNKRSLALNLKHPEGRQAFLRLVEGADILVENFRPGTMESLGLGWEDVRRVNPRLIYCSITGFGRTGPYSGRAGFDLIAQGMSGLMSVTGVPGAPPVKVGVPIADINAGLQAVIGILSAYIHRLRTGEGQLVDTSLLEAGVATTYWESAEYWGTGRVPQPTGSAHRLSAPYQALRCRDGYITVGGASQANWERLCKALGLEHLLQDPRFATGPERLRNREELARILEEVLTRAPVSHWLRVLEEAGVPAGPIYRMDQVYEDPHILARGMRAEVEHPAGGTFPNVGIPIKLSLTPPSIRRRPPLLGEHTEEILQEAGYSPEEVERMLAEGVALSAHRAAPRPGG